MYAYFCSRLLKDYGKKPVDGIEKTMNFLAVIFANLFTSDDPAKTGGGCLKVLIVIGGILLFIAVCCHH